MSYGEHWQLYLALQELFCQISYLCSIWERKAQSVNSIGFHRFITQFISCSQFRQIFDLTLQYVLICAKSKLRLRGSAIFCTFKSLLQFTVSVVCHLLCQRIKQDGQVLNKRYRNYAASCPKALAVGWTKFSARANVYEWNSGEQSNCGYLLKDQQAMNLAA